MEVFVQVFVSVEVNDIFETAQELVVRAVVLQDKHVAKVSGVSLISW